jgi:hypothetical protein
MATRHIFKAKKEGSTRTVKGVLKYRSDRPMLIDNWGTAHPIEIDTLKYLMTVPGLAGGEIHKAKG